MSSEGAKQLVAVMLNFILWRRRSPPVPKKIGPYLRICWNFERGQCALCERRRIDQYTLEFCSICLFLDPITCQRTNLLGHYVSWPPWPVNWSWRPCCPFATNFSWYNKWVYYNVLYCTVLYCNWIVFCSFSSFVVVWSYLLSKCLIYIYIVFSFDSVL